jgi:protoporphyrin/coproporphyrin ferrochelatase
VTDRAAIPVTRHLDAGSLGGAKPRVGVLLLHVGGPDSTAGIAPFYGDLFAESEVLPLGLGELMRGSKIAGWLETALPELTQQYTLIGARSPLADLAASQALALENLLNGKPMMAMRTGGAFRVHAAQRFGRDSIREAVARFVELGVERLVAIPLYPCASRALSGLCVAEFERVVRGTPLAGRTALVESFHSHPGYLRAMVERIRRTLDLVPPVLRDETFLLFAVHSPPHARAKDDAYLDEIERTAQALMRAVGFDEGRSAVAFQSFRAPCRHLDPTIDEFVVERAKAGVKAMVTVPVSYVTDSFETLHDLDIRSYKHGAENGVKQMRRTPSLNADVVFLRALADLATTKLEPALAALAAQNSAT